MRNRQAHSFKRKETLFLLGLAGAAIIWSWFWECYDMRWPLGRVIITLAAMAASFGVMIAGLTYMRISGPGKIMGAFLAILPWNSLLLSQIPYIGYLMIPLEIAVSILLLLWVLPLTIGKAFVLATITRFAAFGVTISVTAMIRNWMIP